MNKFFHWLDNNLLTVLAGFLLIFIPLYPKWPLFDILYGYNVRVRLEDFFVAITLAIFLVQLLRKKISFSKNPTSVGLILYLIAGFLSVLVSIFVIQTVPFQYLHVAKTVLHWLRRIEYLSLFFIFFAAIRSLKISKILVLMFFLALIGVIAYGFGQKYLYWPAFSTMNREFAKGWWLYLTEHARVLSTFGGHYDLAAYLVIALTLSWSFFFGLRNKLHKILVGALISGGFWVLILTASRISFVAYLVGLGVVVFLWTFKKGLGWGVSRLVIATTLSVLLMLQFGDLSDRFLRLARVSERFSGLRNVLLKPSTSPPTNKAVFLENNIAAVTSKSDQPPTPISNRLPSPASRPGDVTGNEEPLLISTVSATGKKILVPKPRTYSQTALMFDLSTSIRLDATWPKAIKGFLADPILGSGYATLTKNTREEFTDAESTDNDFLRALGETGLLGTVAFFGSIVLMIYFVFKLLGGVKDPFLYSLSAGFVGLTVGLLVNALLIDVYEASKVAYVYWGLSGLVLGTLYLEKNKLLADREPLRIKFTPVQVLPLTKKIFLSDKLWLVILVIVAFWLRTYKIDNPLADWHSWRQADTSAVTRNFIKNDLVDWLYPTYDDLSSVASGKPNPQGFRFVEFPLYNAATVIVKKVFPEFSVETAGRVTTSLTNVTSLAFIFLLCRRLLGRKVAYLSAITYALLPYNIYYGRVILPDPSMVTASLGSLYFASSYIFKQKWWYLVLSLVLAIFALLIKPFAIFLLLPISYLWLISYRTDYKKWALLIMFFVIAFIPLLLWRFWINHFPEGIPASDWLLNGDGIRFKGAFWYWLFADRIGRLILGYWGLVLLGFGLVRKTEGKYRFFPILFLLSSFLYLFVFATGNVRHDYYQILLIPSLAIIIGIGLDFLLFESPKLTQFTGLTRGLALVSFAFMLAFGWYFVKDYYNINHPEIVEAGQAVEKLNSEKALVVAPYDGDTAFLYQTNRKGWPIVEQSIDYLIKNGADYFVSVRFDDLTNQLIKQSWPINRGEPPPNKGYKYKLLSSTDKYVIIQLVPDKLLPKD